MSLGILWFILIGLAVGRATTLLVKKDNGFGTFGNLSLGVLGALLGGFAFDVVNLTTIGLPLRLITATSGAIILPAIVALIHMPTDTDNQMRDSM